MSEPRDLTSEDVAGACDLEIVPVDVPEWGGRIYMRPLSTQEADDRAVREVSLKDELGDREHYRGYRLRLVQDFACDASGARIFAGDEGAALLRSKAGAVVARLAREAEAIDGKASQRVEDLAGKSEGAPGSD